MSPPSTPRPPVTVLSGFLGAGKTTLLRHLLGQAAGRRWAAVVNDVAAVNIDAQVVRTDGAARVVELGNGCVCCTVRDDLAETIAELAATGAGPGRPFDHIFVETTGVADPRGVADLFLRKNAFWRSLADFADLQALVTVIDARAFLDAWTQSTLATPAVAADAPLRPERKPVFELMVDQAECADLLVLNKADLVTAEERPRLEAVLRGLNARADLVWSEHGRLAGEVLLGRRRFDAVATPAAPQWMRALATTAAGGVWKLARPPRPSAKHTEEFGLTSWVWTVRRPLRREAWAAWWATQRPAGLLRAKGFFWLAEQPTEIGFLSVAGGQVRWETVGTWVAALREAGVITDAAIPATARARWEEPHGDRRVELVFIGVDLDEARMRAGLAACLA